MLIKSKESFGKESKLSVESYVVSHVSYTYSDGAVERLEEKISSTISAFGRLIETLADKGFLDASEIQHIARGYQFDTDIKLVKTP